MPKSQSGIAQIFVLLLLVAGVGVSTYLVQQRTNIIPFAICGSYCEGGDEEEEEDEPEDQDDEYDEPDDEPHDEEPSSNENNDNSRDDGDTVTDDGQSLDTQDEETKRRFRETYGEDAEEQWAREHEEECRQGKCGGGSEEERRDREEKEDRVNELKEKLKSGWSSQSERERIEREIFGLEESLKSSKESIESRLERELAGNIGFDQIGAIIGRSGLSPKESSERAIQEVIKRGGDINDSAGASAIAAQSAGGNSQEIMEAASRGAVGRGGTSFDELSAATATGNALNLSSEEVARITNQIASSRNSNKKDIGEALAGVPMSEDQEKSLSAEIRESRQEALVEAPKELTKDDRAEYLEQVKNELKSGTRTRSGSASRLGGNSAALFSATDTTNAAYEVLDFLQNAAANIPNPFANIQNPLSIQSQPMTIDEIAQNNREAAQKAQTINNIYTLKDGQVRSVINNLK